MAMQTGRPFQTAFFGVVAFLASMTFSGEVAQAGQPARLYNPKASTTSKALPAIPGLSFKSESVEVEDGVAVFKGQYSRPGWTLYWRSKKQQLKGSFSLSIAMNAKSAALDLVATGPGGKVEQNLIGVYFPTFGSKATTQKTTSEGQQPTLRFLIIPSAALTSSAFTQTSFADYSQIALLGKLAASYAIVPAKWTADWTSFFTLLPLTSSQSDTSVRYFGTNLRIGYTFGSEDWKFSVFGGGYYSTMIVTNDKFGYKNVEGPQLYPVVRRILSSNSSMAAYFKFSPVTDGTQLLAMSNREIASGLSYTRVGSSGHPLSYTLDYANFSLSQTISTSVVTLRNTSISAGMGYGF